MDFLWFKPPNELNLLRNGTPYQQVKTMVDCLKVYENQLHSELKKVAKAKAEIAMILVSDEYAEKILTHQHEDKGER